MIDANFVLKIVCKVQFEGCFVCLNVNSPFESLLHLVEQNDQNNLKEGAQDLLLVFIFQEDLSELD